MYTVKDNKQKQISGISAIANNVVQKIVNVYAIVQNKAVLVWTSIADAINSVFGAGYWANDNSWNNDDLWKNE